MNKRRTVSMALMLLVLSGSLFAQGITRTPWEMNRGRGYIVLPTSLTSHGSVAAYDSASVPAVDASGWEDAPDLVSIGFSETSIIPNGYCYSAVDYTYFQTFVDVPTGTAVTEFTIDFSGMDDGCRVSLYNSDNPDGLVIPGSYVTLGSSGTTNLASYVTEGVNRVVVTQVDDCPSGNNLQSAVVVLNGESVGMEATEQTFTVYGANGEVGSQDPYIQALAEGSSVWTQAYLIGTHPWGLVPGTSSWLNFDPDNTVGTNTSTPYRIRFMVPEDYTNPSMVFQVKADNLGIIYVNDTYIDSVEGGDDTPNSPDALIEEALRVGMNEIRITMVDWGSIVGLNYRIDVTMTSSEDISDAVLTPEDAAELNNAPVADAGDDYESTSSDVMLDGSGSSDPDGNVLLYYWILNGDTVATGVNPTVTLPNGVHAFTLAVTDGELWDTDEVMIYVDAVEVVPDVEITMVPRFGSEYVDADGGRVVYDLAFRNNTERYKRFAVIIGATHESGASYRRLADTPWEGWLYPGEMVYGRMVQRVPSWVMPGQWDLYCFVGNGQNSRIDSVGFTVMKAEGAALSEAKGELSEWSATYANGALAMANDRWTADGFYREDGSDIFASTLSAEDEIVPESYELSQNYPNPFNPSTTISFALPTAGEVNLRVYDINGVEVAQLVQGQMSAGHHRVDFAPSNLSSGTYLYVLETGSFREVKRMVYLK